MYKNIIGTVTNKKVKYNEQICYEEVLIEVHPIFFWRNLKTKLYATDSIHLEEGDKVKVMYDTSSKQVVAIRRI